MADGARTEQQEAEGPVPSRVEVRRSYFREHPGAKWMLLAVLVVLAAGTYWLWSYYSTRESTDDAQIDGHIDPISARVGGTIVEVNVDDNQVVKAGTVLVRIDPKDYQVALDRTLADAAAARATAAAAQSGVPITETTTESRVDTADAGVLAASAGVEAARKEVAAAQAQLVSAQARQRESEARSQLAQQNLARMKQLVARDEISQQQFDVTVSDAQVALAAVDSARAAVAQAEQGVAVAQSHVAQAQAALAQAQASVQAARVRPQQIATSRAEAGSASAKLQLNQTAVEQAQLNIGYTVVRAPVDGIVSRKSVELGQVVQAGQPLLALVETEDIWVTADYKETQLRLMRVGQPAIVKVDAFGGREYDGHVDSIAAATGARFSLLPPENATGNYVKVVQRLPVKIVLEKGQDPQRMLRPGMSVEATVITK
ncbi:MAG: HlyD family secretion protein [Bryobacteraceae bacterium]|jgi:membrane fusion protein (multidrug efflux system)